MSEARPFFVDMDGVVADFDAEVFARIGPHPDVSPLNPRRNFRLADDYPEHKALIKDIYRQPGFFAALPLVDGAIEGWQRALELGHDPQICTSPVISNPTCRAEKLGWLEEHFAPIFGIAVVDRAIVTLDKYQFDGFALLDDRPQIEDAHRASWQHIIFDRDYNRHVDGPRLNGWHDENLGALLSQAQRLYRGIGAHSIEHTD